jgi:hypothetical protein
MSKILVDVDVKAEAKAEFRLTVIDVKKNSVLIQSGDRRVWVDKGQNLVFTIDVPVKVYT